MTGHCKYTSTRSSWLSWVTVGFCAVLLIGGPMDWASAATALPKEALPNLLVGQENLPWDCVLFSAEMQPGHRTETQMWVGAPNRRKGLLTHPISTIDINVTIMPSAGDTARVVTDILRGCQQPPKEVAWQQPFAFLGDRVWYGDNRFGANPVTDRYMVMVRGNVVYQLSMAQASGVDQADILALASRLSDRVRDALAGKPHPAAVLPPSAEEMGMTSEAAWEAAHIGKALSRRSTTIALQHGKNDKALPATSLSKTDYLVPLSHLAAAMGSSARVTVTKGQATAQVAGKTVVFFAGKATVTVDGKIIAIGCEPQFNGKQVFVPISVLEKILGKRIAWGKTGKLVTASM